MKTPLNRCHVLLPLLLAGVLQTGAAHAQTAPGPLEDPEPVIAAQLANEQTDEKIANRIASIFQVIGTLAEVEVSVSEGVVKLAGDVPNEAAATQAQQLAIRIEGVVTVRDEMNRTLALSDNVEPLWQQTTSTLSAVFRALPLIGVALALALSLSFLGAFLARRKRLLSKAAPNAFVVELLAQAIRIGFIGLGVVLALNLLGAGSLVTTILGGAGVLGLAVGFAVRDTMGNYISSIMLSLRQPFRAKDHVIVNDHEGIVVRLTSRATVLMTLDGNHLRIPNSDVFKGTILNFTTNPERRFEFELGVDAADDPVAAMYAGQEAMEALPFVLTEPEPSAVIATVGDSNIVLRFYAWIDQRETNYGKARSLAIRTAMRALEEGGFTLPEPIYRLRFDETPVALTQTRDQSTSSDDEQVAEPVSAATGSDARPPLDEDTVMDVQPDNHLAEKVEEEIREGEEHDLLDEQTPKE
ncbi:MAG: mechanosensitive ion channel family protein [Halioglobus sp.]